MEKSEPAEIRRLFEELVKAPVKAFPKARGKMDAPWCPGVYIIRDPEGRPAHVGSTPRGKWGIGSRLRQHLQGKSSFVYYYLNAEPARLRDGFTFQCIEVQTPRTRALLEAYAIGSLCPLHIGVTQTTAKGASAG